MLVLNLFHIRFPSVHYSEFTAQKRLLKWVVRCTRFIIAPSEHCRVHCHICLLKCDIQVKDNFFTHICQVYHHLSSHSWISKLIKHTLSVDNVIMGDISLQHASTYLRDFSSALLHIGLSVCVKRMKTDEPQVTRNKCNTINNVLKRSYDTVIQFCASNSCSAYFNLSCPVISRFYLYSVLFYRNVK
jgi:hypothetical protein